MIAGSSCSQSLTVATNETAKNKDLVDLPAAIVDDSDFEYSRFAEKEMVLALTKENTLYREEFTASADKAVNRSETILTKDAVPELLTTFFSDKDPDKRIVFLKADRDTVFGNVLQFFEYVRKGEIDRVGVVITNQDKAANRMAVGFTVRLPAKPKDRPDLDVKPNPLTLVASLGADGRFSLNNEDHGRLPDTQRLESRLREIFSERERKAVFREGTNEVEKTMFLKVSTANKYSDFVQLLGAVKNAGASPVGVQIDDVD
jgi:biopolymer transport protein ExbD